MVQLFVQESTESSAKKLLYNLYLLMIILSFFAMDYHEKRGKWPLMGRLTNWSDIRDSDTSSKVKNDTIVTEVGKTGSV